MSRRSRMPSTSPVRRVAGRTHKHATTPLRWALLNTRLTAAQATELGARCASLLAQRARTHSLEVIHRPLAAGAVAARLTSSVERLPRTVADLTWKQTLLDGVLALTRTRRGSLLQVNPSRPAIDLLSSTRAGELRYDSALLSPGFAEIEVADIAVWALRTSDEHPDPDTRAKCQHFLEGFVAATRFKGELIPIAFGTELLTHAAFAAHDATDHESLRRTLRLAAYLLSAHQSPQSIKAVVDLINTPRDPWIDTDVNLIDRQRVPGADDNVRIASDAWVSVVDAPLGSHMQIGGRIGDLRIHRSTVFGTLEYDGATLQFSLPRSDFEALGRKVLRPSDLVVLDGALRRTEAGELDLAVHRIVSHRPSRLDRSLPIKTPDPAVLAAQSDLRWRVREHLQQHGFAEQHTRVLDGAYKGGDSQPFRTSLVDGRPLFMRVTTELAHMRQMAAGVPRTFDLGPSFRNKTGLRGNKTPEFIMLEAYASDLGLDQMVDVTAGLILRALGEPQGGGRLRHLTTSQAFELFGVDMSDHSEVRHFAQEHKVALPVGADPITAIRKTLDGAIGPRLPGIVVLSRIPGGGSPLIRGRGEEAQRRWLFYEGTEVCEVAQNEVNVDVLKAHFDEQFARDPHPLPRDYRDVLEVAAHGMPDFCGVGIGLTRLLDIRLKNDGLSTSHSELII